MLNFRFLLILMFATSALQLSAQQAVPYQQLLLLVAGPSGDRIDPQEQAVVSYLNSLRGDYELYNLQMGTMHYDRPKEAQLLKGPLGFSPDAGITVGLVQLSEQGLPVRTLYKMEKETAGSLEREHRHLLGQWSKLSSQTLPAELRADDSVPSSSQNPNVGNTPPNISPPKAPQVEQVYTFEGIRTTVISLQERSDALWQNTKGQSLREDRMDVPVRQASLKLAEAATNLRQAHEAGVIYPLEQLQAVRLAGREWRLTEPQFFLPVELRAEVEPISRLLKVLEAIEYQAGKS